MVAQRQEIECWRVPAVTREGLARTCDILVAEGVVRHGGVVATVLERAGRDPDAAYSVSVHGEGLGLDDDEARGWLWVAACAGHADASLQLAKLLTGEARSAATEADARVLGELAQDWYAVAARRRGKAPLSGLKPLPSAPDDHLPDPEEPEVAEPSGPVRGRVVIGPIGDPASKEGQELARRFGAVADRRLPYAGSPPRPMEARDAILARYPWAVAVAEAVEGHFAVIRKAHATAASRGLPPPAMSLPNLLLVGGKGAGKSTLAQMVCAIAGIPARTVPCGGVSDAAGIAPVTRAWSTTRPGAIVQAMAAHGVANPALVLEEIDKTTVAGSQNGSVAAALLSMVGAGSFHDSSLMADVDVRSVTFIATGNDLAAIDGPLRDRFEVVFVPSPGVEHLPVIHRNALARFCEDRGLDPATVPALGRGEHALLREWFLRNGRSARAYSIMHDRLVSTAIAAEERQEVERIGAIQDPFERFAAMGAPTGLSN